MELFFTRLNECNLFTLDEINYIIDNKIFLEKLYILGLLDGKCEPIEAPEPSNN